LSLLFAQIEQVCSSSAVAHLTKYLLKHGADANITDASGQTPLQAELGRARKVTDKICRLLESHGAVQGGTDVLGAGNCTMSREISDGGTLKVSLDSSVERRQQTQTRSALQLLHNKDSGGLSFSEDF
jgi:ankyrin repeat protein